jgi:NAD(P)-dependent dehydrogenase (short-subunit alcohol dehydrogenase family)
LNVAPGDAARVALVTGGAQGLGRAIAERLGGAGMRLILADIDAVQLEATATALSGRFDVQAVVVDVADEASVAACFAAVEERHGRLDVLVNNAGVIGLVDGKRPLVEDMPLALWQRTLDVNLTGAFLACRGAVPLMKRGGWGRIVNISSRAGRTRTGVGHANYAATKAGLIGFSRVLAGEVGRHGITVNCVAPSRIPTAMTLTLVDSASAFERNIAETAVGRLGTPLDVADAVAYLASDAASFLTGIVIDVNGGSFMP